MALDVYVMPLIKFKRGEYTLGSERVSGMKATIMTATGQTYERKLSEIRARNEIEKIQEAVRMANRGATITWMDEGEVVFAEQIWWTFTGLKAYARWVDLREEFPTFDSPPAHDWYKHPTCVWKGEKDWTFPAVVGHSLFAGYLLPCDFTRSVLVEPYIIGSWKFFKSVGSAMRMLPEIEGLAELLGVKEEAPSDDDFMNDVRLGAWMLRKAVRLACAKGLPVIFFG
jgi:hypothetical protein